MLGPKLTPLKSSLTSSLLQSLSSPSNRKSSIVRLISLLVRLNAGAAARNTFLATRTDVMRKRVRMITFEGHIGMYISDLAIVIFTGIKHTADWFLASFKENEVASCAYSLLCTFTLAADVVNKALSSGQRSRWKYMRICSGSKCSARTSVHKQLKRPRKLPVYIAKGYLFLP
jgi:hypothetical protein